MGVSTGQTPCGQQHGKSQIGIRRRHAAVLLAAATALTGAVGTKTARATTYYWDAANGAWENSANWSTDPNSGTVNAGTFPGSAADAATFNQSSNNGSEAVSLSQADATGTLTFNNTGTTLLQSSSATAQTLTIGSGVTVAAAAGAATIGNASNPLNVTLGATQTWTVNSSAFNPLTVNAGIGDGGGAFGLTKAGTGVLVLGGADTYTGATAINAGTLRLTNTAALATSAVTLANGATLDLRSNTSASFATGAVTLNSGTINVDNNGSGTGQALAIGGTATFNANTTVNVTSAGGDTLALGTVGGAGANQTDTWNANGANVSITAMTASGGGDNNLVFGGNGTFTFASLQNGGANREASFTVNTSGGVTFNGTVSNNINNDTSINNNASVSMNNGTLLLDFSNLGTPTNLITRSGTHSTTFFNLGGGTLKINGKTGGTATSQNFFGGTTFNAGASAISIANNGTSTTTLTLNAITRNVGGTVDLGSSAGVFGTDSRVTTSTITNVNGILGGYATVGGSTWAVAPSVAGSPITGLPDAGYSNTAATALGTAASTANVDVAAAGSNASAVSQVVNSLRFNDASGAASVDATNGLTLTTGGILVTPNVSNNPASISGGTLAGASGADLVVNQDDAAAGLTIGSTIADNTTATALTKSGGGLLTLSNPANTFTGKTYLNAGTLNIAADASLGTAPAAVTATQLTLNGGTLQFGGAFSLATNRGITLGLKGGTIDTNGFTASYAGVIAGVSGANGTLSKAGGGSLTLSGADTYAAGTQVAAGALVAANAAALGTGPVTVNGGALSSSVANVNVGPLSLTIGSVAPGGAGVGSFTLAAGKNLAMSGGTLAETIASAGSFDKVVGSGAGTFTITGGTLDLSSSTGIDYTQTYPILSGFAGGAVSGLAITGYDTTDYTASLSNGGVLSFAANVVPEPASAALIAVGGLGLVARRRRHA